MNPKRTALLFGPLITALVATAVFASGDEPSAGLASDRAATPGASVQTPSGPVAIPDARYDVSRPKLDIQMVTVINKPAKLKIRVYFPGVVNPYDLPTGAVSVFLGTDASRPGAEYGHFMDFWSEHRFAEVDHWREQPTPAWAHAPEGECVATAGVQSDKQSRLRWFEYVVTRSDGCFDADAVRVAVSTINPGDLDPPVKYSRPAHDHLTAKHAWSRWITVRGGSRP